MEQISNFFVNIKKFQLKFHIILIQYNSENNFFELLLMITSFKD